jgi:hypothetical protein
MDIPAVSVFSLDIVLNEDYMNIQIRAFITALQIALPLMPLPTVVKIAFALLELGIHPFHIRDSLIKLSNGNVIDTGLRIFIAQSMLSVKHIKIVKLLIWASLTRISRKTESMAITDQLDEGWVMMKKPGIEL